MIEVPGMRLGKLEPRFIKGLPVLGALTAELPPPPPSVKNSVLLKALGAMANDTTSDCTCAAIGHTIEMWTSMASTEVVLSDEVILQLYSDSCGYVPGDPQTDQGGVASEVLMYWYKNPVSGHPLNGFASIRPGNRTSIKDSIFYFGVCYLGVQLPLTAQKGNWILPAGQATTGNWEPGSWGGHAIPAVDYDDKGVTVITWGKLLKASWNWLDAYMDEGYALLSKDWLETTGNTPAGLNWASLQTDMNSLRVSP